MCGHVLLVHVDETGLHGLKGQQLPLTGLRVRDSLHVLRALPREQHKRGACGCEQRDEPKHEQHMRALAECLAGTVLNSKIFIAHIKTCGSRAQKRRRERVCKVENHLHPRVHPRNHTGAAKARVCGHEKGKLKHNRRALNVALQPVEELSGYTQRTL